MQWVTVENGRHWRLDSSSNQHLGWQLVSLKYFSPFSFCLIRSKVTLKGWAFYYWYIAFVENFIEIVNWAEFPSRVAMPIQKLFFQGRCFWKEDASFWSHVDAYFYLSEPIHNVQFNVRYRPVLILGNLTLLKITNVVVVVRIYPDWDY